MTETASSIVSVRITPSERELLETIAGENHTSLSDFVRRRAVEAAEMEVLERRAAIIPADKWEQFEAWIHEKPQPDPALAELMTRKPTWEE